MTSLERQSLLARIEALPDDRISEIEDFVAFVSEREARRRLTSDAADASGPALARMWSNSDDDVYDAL